MIKLTMLLTIVLIAMFCVSCQSTKNLLVHQVLLPTPPQTPALQNPELLSDIDRHNLAIFYRDFEKYLEKLNVYKKYVF